MGTAFNSAKGMLMRMWMKMTVVAVLVLGLTGQAAAAQPSDKQVRQLFEVMHLNQMFTQMNSQMAGMMGQEAPCVPASYWQDFIDAKASEQLLAQMVPVYQRHFTAQDVSGLLKFYKSALGQKVITEMPQTMAEGMKIGQQWGRQRGLEMVRQLQQQGTLDASGRCPASPAASTPLSAPSPSKSTH
jgi:hypothetical protein